MQGCYYLLEVCVHLHTCSAQNKLTILRSNRKTEIINVFYSLLSTYWSVSGDNQKLQAGDEQQVWSGRELVRQSQIVQSVIQDCQYNLSHLLPVCNLLVQGSKITYNYYLSRWFLNFIVVFYIEFRSF